MQNVTWQPASRGGFLPPITLAATRRQPMFGQQPTFGLAGRQRLAAPRYRMGATAEEWYARAGSALARFDFLKGQINSVNNIGARDAIVRWLGSVDIVDSPEYRYNSVLDDYVNDVAVKGIEGTYGVDPDSPSGPGRRQNRVVKLDDINEVFNEKIATAQATHGTRPTDGTPVPTKPPAPAHRFGIVAHSKRRR